MGYREYICKVDNIKKFAKLRYKVDHYIDTECCDEVGYDLVEFKESFNNVKRGLYIYVYGDRGLGANFIRFLKSGIVGRRSYSSNIEEAIGYIPFSGDKNIYSDKLISLFKEKSNSFGRVIYQKKPSLEKGNELERSLF